MKKKMLYISHVDWNWIKQRPHFLAEGLMEELEVTVLYQFQNRNRKALQKRSTAGKNIMPLYSLPFARRVKPLGAINNPFLKAQVSRQVKRLQPDYLFLTYPTQVDYIPSDYAGMVIYDCMDDHGALAPDFLRQTVRQKESALLNRADIILHSSENLRKVLNRHYGESFHDKMHLIRNGYSGKIASVAPGCVKEKDEFTISYVGTIGEWFNFEYILKSLQDIPKLRYKIIGPAEVTLPENERIEYTGTVEHHRLYDAIKDTDCLTMPFVINDIVLSVDPVKLYEYINYNKNILCVRYPEIGRFEPFVYFYEDYDTFLNQIKKMMKDNRIKYDNESRIRFLQENNWESRVREITRILGDRK